MTYDVDNRLDTYIQTENNKTTKKSNLYNGDGQRIQKTEEDNYINLVKKMDSRDRYFFSIYYIESILHSKIYLSPLSLASLT